MATAQLSLVGMPLLALDESLPAMVEGEAGRVLDVPARSADGSPGGHPWGEAARATMHLGLDAPRGVEVGGS